MFLAGIGFIFLKLKHQVSHPCENIVCQSEILVMSRSCDSPGEAPSDSSH